jgi:deoxyribose-phosphate aldolase
MVLMREELGVRYLERDLFRFGASGLLADIERQLEHHLSGRYAALHHQPLA